MTSHTNTGHADIVVISARLLTMDALTPRAQALAIRGNRIVFVGDNAGAKALAGPATRVFDAGGATVMPGFNESHLHIFEGALSLTQLGLQGVRGREALRAAIVAYAEENPDLPLLTGMCADYRILGDRGTTRHDLDEIIADRPFMMLAADHHTAWANTIALAKAGILHGRELGVGNRIAMGDDGIATGELLESEAFGPVAALGITGGRESLGMITGGSPGHVGAKDRASDIAVIERGLKYCASLGITSIQNMDGNLYQLEMLSEIEATQGLPVRVRMPFHMKNFMPIGDLAEKAAAWRERFSGDRLRCDFIKMFADGVVESGTAVLAGGYADNPDENGVPLFTQQFMNEIVCEADRLGLQIAVHAIGSGAVRQILDAYETAIDANGRRDSRHRIEHIETIEPHDIPRIQALGAVASMQPTHPPGAAGSQLEPYLSRIGESRWPYAFAWRTIADTGARLVVGTDWPVTDLNPLACIEAAMTRQPWKHGLKDQRLTLLEVLEAYTKTGAWVEFMDDRKGVLRPGYFADVVVLDEDIESVGLHEIGRIRPVLTICDGRVSFEVENAPSSQHPHQLHRHPEGQSAS